MDEKDRLLLTHLHNGIPLTGQPFGTLAAKVGVDQAGVLVRVQRLIKEGILAGIKPVLDPHAFYYQSVWVAMRFGPSELAPNTEIILQHPGVVYACERDHEFNFWFFLAVPAEHDLELHVRYLEKISGARGTLFLPVRKVYKGADYLNSLDAGLFAAMGERYEKRQEARLPDLTAQEIEVIRWLQEPFLITDEPYETIAEALNLPVEKIITIIKTLTHKGFLRRIGSFLRLPETESSTKTLVAWQIPEEKLLRIGPEIHEFREVLYGDRRPLYPEFPYSLYTMIRAANAAELEVVARRMQDRIGKWPHRVLTTLREFKKIGMRYFPKELNVWWTQSRSMVAQTF
ncbi:MAG TPA: hypothetical protein PLO78_00155 [Candidatus Omnitrophota bacterium]|nr:hypothetical protein [Candidatus Omnitrophota bacterium]